jgi:D-alanine--poly(phosphoribitol) ligase subunit 2
MSEREEVFRILKDIKPMVELDGVNDIIDGGYLDSLELMSLIAALMEKYEIEIDVDWITPENFNSIDSIANMIAQLKSST